MLRSYTRGAFLLLLLILLGVAGYWGWGQLYPRAIDAPLGQVAQTPITPSRLVIPSIGVDAAVQHVGVGSSGNMAVPTNYTDVGWYKLGPMPGEMGSAVIDGHLDNGYGLPAVFNDLDKLKMGDKIYVTDATGAQLEFVVTGSSIYDPLTADREEVFGNHGTRELNLITCDGAWQATKKTYEKRLVVFSELVTI